MLKRRFKKGEVVFVSNSGSQYTYTKDGSEGTVKDDTYGSYTDPDRKVCVRWYKLTNPAARPPKIYHVRARHLVLLNPETESFLDL